MKKSIYFNGRFLDQPFTGVQRFAHELLTNLNQLITGAEYSGTNFVCLVPRSIDSSKLPKWENIKIKPCGRLKGNLWEQIELPFHARKGLLVNLCNIGPVFHPRQLVVMHDASVFAVPEAYSFPFRFKYKTIFYILSRTALRIFTDSQFSRNELSHFLHIPKEIIEILPLGSDHILNVEADYSLLKKHTLKKNQYFLAVGSASKHKNVISVIQALETSEIDLPGLALTGGSFSKVFQNQAAITTNRVKSLGYVTDAQLRALYENALAFVFPSLYEGFGLPPLEAMRCGCPVISSNRASLPEVCGDAVLYIDPTNQEEIRNSLRDVADSPDLRSELKKKGLERADQFSWMNAAQIFRDILMNEIRVQ